MTQFFMSTDYKYYSLWANLRPKLPMKNWLPAHYQKIQIEEIKVPTKSEFIRRLDVLARAIYETPEGGCGCCLHIVLDDGNFERHHVEYCLENAEHGICREVAEMLLKLTEEGRELAVGHGVINFLAVKESQIEL
jgi:hypothetical protein